jgi:hypothetical protein
MLLLFPAFIKNEIFFKLTFTYSYNIYERDAEGFTVRRWFNIDIIYDSYGEPELVAWYSQTN